MGKGIKDELIFSPFNLSYNKSDGVNTIFGFKKRINLVCQVANCFGCKATIMFWADEQNDERITFLTKLAKVVEAKGK
ncbi:MAG: hypothetical protein GX467_10125 [Rikenellaceae bacterium]|nr:hypothetical protein [Bacteroidales bacterium]NLH57190.1 hypothetical protein [Rikenellaceae bacterium]HOM85561.1 hypothetical protein [Tenuifilaceae bacterium]HOU63450.1 hypothetical protein [Tenuifilaceae bacterium]HPC69139.1 hypothetical protein [Tenuifilaceae bacterium]